MTRKNRASPTHRTSEGRKRWLVLVLLLVVECEDDEEDGEAPLALFLALITKEKAVPVEDCWFIERQLSFCVVRSILFETELPPASPPISQLPIKHAYLVFLLTQRSDDCHLAATDRFARR
ncbi:unnamed protein product [Soboliphyme baturini]|uniref:Secreted protein n=1 Tax=Soboliphyme baturini TaxID=241478 RepID=A0A183J0N3_9BILA|nr:unnamed protein product [Soboliphyme baturini]